jgi:ATP-dependent Clp protease ATP-binding subunit ClpC
MDAASGNSEFDWINRSRSEAERMGHHFIAPEHVFLAMAHAKEAKVSGVLAQLGCSVAEVARIIENIMEHVDPGKPGKNVPLTRSAEEMLKHSLLESRSRKAFAIDEYDVLFGMLKDRSGVIAVVMKQRWHNGYDEVRALI